MNGSQPSRIATWLFKRLASGPKQDSVLGDLFEQHQRGRSRAWYWWQVLTAIIVGAVYDVHEYYVLTLRAIALWFVLAGLTAYLTLVVYHSLGIWMWNWTIAQDWDTLRIIWFGRRGWSSPPLLLMSCVNAAMIGWVIARLHRGHAAATLFSCAAFSVFWLIVVRWWSPGVNYWPVTLAPMPFYALVPSLVALIGAPASFLLGGLFGSKPWDDASEQSLQHPGIPRSG
jgi:hypothetical protein